MARLTKLKFDRGTLIVHPPPKGRNWLDFATWDDRIEKFRVSAIDYRPLIETLKQEDQKFIDEAKEFYNLELAQNNLAFEPYPHQKEALHAWKKIRGRV